MQVGTFGKCLNDPFGQSHVEILDHLHVGLRKFRSPAFKTNVPQLKQNGKKNYSCLFLAKAGLNFKEDNLRPRERSSEEPMCQSSDIDLNVRREQCSG